jgi:hypothetical protein
VTRADGFSMIEVLMASAIAVTVIGGIIAVIIPAQALVRAQGDAADLHQRLRAAADTMAGDVRGAAEVRPYRVGAVRDDGIAGVYYRPDTMTVLGDTMRTYYFKADAFELMQYDGGLSDLPMIEHVVRLAFEYFGAASAADEALVRLDPGVLIDGPWSEDASHRLFDNDVRRIREVRILIRLETTAPSLRRLVPDEEMVVHVALRNRAAAE